MALPIITLANAKLQKGEKLGYLSAGIHFAPASLSGRNVCAFSSAGCRSACLNTAGRGVYSRVQNTRIKKTQWFYSDTQGFMAQLIQDIKALVRKAARENKKTCFRPNITSDLDWRLIKYQGKTIFEHFPEVEFMDYTKIPQRMDDYLANKFPANYHLTFSRSEVNEVECFKVLIKGGNVAVVFRGELPKTWMGKKVVSGDKTDLRFLDPDNCIVGLSTKGRARKDQSGFVVESAQNNK